MVVELQRHIALSSVNESTRFDKMEDDDESTISLLSDTSTLLSSTTTPDDVSNAKGDSLFSCNSDAYAPSWHLAKRQHIALTLRKKIEDDYDGPEFIPPGDKERRKNLDWFEGLSERFQANWFEPDEPRTKTLRFCLDENETFEGGYITEDEIRRCWYDSDDLVFFHQNVMNAIKTLSPSTEKQSTFFAWVSSGSSVCSSVSGDEACHVDVNECISSVYKACCCSEQNEVMVNREELKLLYIQNQDLVGLEELLLSPERGNSDTLCRFILRQAAEQHREVNTGRQRRVSIERRGARHEEENKQENECFFSSNPENIFVRVSQMVSRPASLLANELALAQAEALVIIQRSQRRRGSRSRDGLSSSRHSRRSRRGSCDGSSFRHNESLAFKCVDV